MISSSEEPGREKKKKQQQNLREDLEKLLCLNQKSCLESVRLFSTQTGKREFLSLQQTVLTWYKQNVMLICGEGNGTPLQYFAWKIPWMEELGRLQSMGSQRVRHNWATCFHFSFSCIREGNGNPLQCSCLENPRDGGAVYGVAQSQTWLSDFPFTFHFHALEKEMAAHSSVLAWRIPGTGEPGGCRL